MKKFILCFILFVISEASYSMTIEDLIGRYRGVNLNTNKACVLTLSIEGLNLNILLRESGELILPKVIIESFLIGDIVDRVQKAEERGYISFKKDFGTASREAFNRFELAVEKDGEITKVDGLKYKNLNYTTRAKSINCTNLKKARY